VLDRIDKDLARALGEPEMRKQLVEARGLAIANTWPPSISAEAVLMRVTLSATGLPLLGIPFSCMDWISAMPLPASSTSTMLGLCRL
jgi:hypothetical protein